MQVDKSVGMNCNDGKVILSNYYLKTLRRHHGLSQESLACLLTEEKLSMSIATVKRAETGKFVSYNTAYKLAKFYKVKVIELIAKDSSLNDKLASRFDSNHTFGQKLNAKLNHVSSVLQNMITLERVNIIVTVFNEESNTKTKLLQNLKTYALNLEYSVYFIFDGSNITQIKKEISDQFSIKDQRPDTLTLNEYVENKNNSKRIIICIDNYDNNKHDILEILKITNNNSNLSVMFLFSTHITNRKLLDDWSLIHSSYPMASFHL